MRPSPSAGPRREPSSTSSWSSTRRCRPASCSASPTASNRRPAGSAPSTGARGRSTWTCCSSVTWWSTSPTWSCPTRGCGSAGSCSRRSPTWRPSSCPSTSSPRRRDGCRWSARSSCPGAAAVVPSRGEPRRAASAGAGAAGRPALRYPRGRTTGTPSRGGWNVERLAVVQVIDRVPVWRKALDAERAAGRVVGVVPTMGALHAGHAALIDRAARECDVVGVTVFVNPLQFAGGEDFDAYPRPLERDEEIAAAHGAAYLFAPSVEEMYPRPVETVVSVPSLSARWDGEARPGHFDGVATVVAKLFAQAGPCRAYFGEKDYQQLCVVRRMVADLDLPAEVVGCPTVREADGLARSSRNVYLSPAERGAAPTLYRALQTGADALRSGAAPADARRAMHAVVAAQPRCDLDYAEPVDADSLAPLEAPLPPGGSARLLIAARLGRTRLIDNLGVTR